MRAQKNKDPPRPPPPSAHAAHAVAKLKKRKKERRENEKQRVRYTSCLVSLRLGRIFSLLREGTWVAAWHFAGFMRPLRMVPGPVHLPPSPPSSRSPCPHPAVHAFGLFCGVAITRQSPLPFGPLMDARCVGTGVPLGPIGLRPNPHAVSRLPPKGHASSFVNPALEREPGGRVSRGNVEFASQESVIFVFLARAGVRSPIRDPLPSFIA